MKSSIEVSAQFDFKGKTFRPTAALDLDALMEHYGELPELHRLLARENHIGPYSYEYEVLESCELAFSNATGIAAEYLEGGRFDTQGFMQWWHEHRLVALLQEIARRHMAVDDLERQPALKAALMEAYAAGKRGA